MTVQNAGRAMVLLNDDTCSLRYSEPPHDSESLEEPLRHLAGSQVGGLCWCMTSGEIAYSWPSRVLENYYDLLAGGGRITLADADGNTSSENFFDSLAVGADPTNVMVSLHHQHIDYVPLLIERTHRHGLKFYASFRMNDCHHKSAPRGLLTGQFWQEHQHYRLWEVTKACTYYNAALDYSFDEVRQRRLAGIGEVLDWYDVDGIELDFCRNCFTFPPSHGWEKRHILTGFMEQLRRLVDDAGARRGKKLDLLLRVPFDERARHEAGMELTEWIKAGLIDVLTMSALVNDYDQSIEPWAGLCRANGVAFYPSIEGGPAHNAAHNHVSPETADEIIKRLRAAAQNFLGQGAAGVYLFNYACHLYQWRRTPDEARRMRDVLKEVGRIETLRGKDKQWTFWKTLPLQLESGRPKEFHQSMAFHLYDHDVECADAQVAIRFRQATEQNPHVDMRHEAVIPSCLPEGWVSYWLNETEVPGEWITRTPRKGGKLASGLSVADHEEIVIAPPAGVLAFGRNTIAFTIPRYPEENDPYVFIYEMTVDISFE